MPVRGSKASSVVPAWLWQMLLIAPVSLAAGGVLLVLLLAAGAADPPLAGPLRWRQEAPRDGCLDVGVISLPNLQLPFTIILAATRRDDADPFDTWGLWLADPVDGPRWEILPPGYYRTQGETFPFHHVVAGRNELRLDLGGGAFQLWLNREQAVGGEWTDSATDWGMIGGGTICWHSLALYGPD